MITFKLLPQLKFSAMQLFWFVIILDATRKALFDWKLDIGSPFLLPAFFSKRNRGMSQRMFLVSFLLSASISFVTF